MTTGSLYSRQLEHQGGDTSSDMEIVYFMTSCHMLATHQSTVGQHFTNTPPTLYQYTMFFSLLYRAWANSQWTLNQQLADAGLTVGLRMIDSRPMHSQHVGKHVWAGHKVNNLHQI